MRTHPDHPSRTLELMLPIALILFMLVIAVLLASSDTRHSPQPLEWMTWTLH